MIHDKFIPPTSITFKGISPHQLIPLLRDFHLHLPPSARPEGNLWIQQETQQGQHQPTSLVAAKRAIRAVMTTRAKSQQRAWRSIKCPTLSTVNPNPHHICVLFARPLHGSPERKDTLWNVPRLLACAASPWNWPFPPFKPILSQELHAVVRGQDLHMAATRLIVSRVWQWTGWLTPYRYFAYVHVYVNIYIYIYTHRLSFCLNFYLHYFPLSVYKICSRPCVKAGSWVAWAPVKEVTSAQQLTENLLVETTQLNLNFDKLLPKNRKNLTKDPTTEQTKLKTCLWNWGGYVWEAIGWMVLSPCRETDLAP